MTKYSIENIVKIDTYIEEYSINDDSLNNEYLVNELDLDILREVFKIKQEDYLISEPQLINENKSKILNSYLKTPVKFDFEKYEYYIQRYAEYK